ncbi:MAG: type II toxin-antitoxin system VapC family toxin [Actinomycetota bacterium]|nr:type II toxin-antitoxin system VapC family toxin [Actinomycetota bacterium]MDZ4180103.1 type II toxin-antitoxin system VapC family toxin [Coriobacteriia bacterium]
MSVYMVVDASVAVKWFKPEGEQHLAEALALLESHRDQSIVLAAPVHLRLEVLNALWSHGLDAQRLTAIARNLEDFDLTWFDIDATLAAHACELAVEHRLTLYDAAYAALALHLDAELVTEDVAILASGACGARSLASD